MPWGLRRGVFSLAHVVKQNVFSPLPRGCRPLVCPSCRRPHTIEVYRRQWFFNFPWFPQGRLKGRNLWFELYFERELAIPAEGTQYYHPLRAQAIKRSRRKTVFEGDIVPCSLPSPRYEIAELLTKNSDKNIGIIVKVDISPVVAVEITPGRAGTQTREENATKTFRDDFKDLRQYWHLFMQVAGHAKILRNV